jgi:antitoxin component YwqK of YwqJK toxin-antitoxin module
MGNTSAVKYDNGHMKWYKNGVLHRDTLDQNGQVLSAVEYANGDKSWYKNGVLHRDNDLPAVEYANGDKSWYKNGVLHRANDLPAAEFANGDKEWYKDGVLHRDTLDQNGDILPAVEYANGDKEWWVNDIQIIRPLLQQIKIKHIPENISSQLSLETRECSICLETIDTKECYCSNECFHIYHKECLNKNQNKCGICER